METVVGMNKASATRNARTAMTGAQNAGRQQAYDRAKAMGIKVKKEWVATLDGRTRHSHGQADGQQVELDGKFTVGRAKMRYPGDVQNGTPEEIYNCRCTMVTVEPPEIMRGEEPRMTYQEWVQTKEGQGTLEKARLERNKEAAKRRKAKRKQQDNAHNGLKSGGDRDKIASRHYDFLDGVLGADAIPFDKAKNLDEIISAIPRKHLDVIEKTIKKVDYVKGRGHCSYNPVTKTLTLDDEKMNGSIIHEFGHVLADAYDIYNDKEFLDILSDGLNLENGFDVKTYYFSEQNIRLYWIENSKFVSAYQGRLYVDQENFEYTQPLDPKWLQEYISVGFNAYFINPHLLKEKDPRFFYYLERMMQSE